ncbi:MAG: hypothetical protein EPN20_06680 [Magnetospirillum sp.]|nr:MAG: hypothetical protein EPN20_06680 [Magnetospirillum sp.]
MTLQTDLAAAVAQVTADSTLLHKVVHGPALGAESEVVTEGGPVKTVARAVADAEEILHREAGDLAEAVSAARAAQDAAFGHAAIAGEKAAEAETAVARTNTAVDQAAADIRAVADTAEAAISGMVAQAETVVQSHVASADEAAAGAEGAAAEARAHAARFALPIEAVARRALTADARQLTGTRDTLVLFAAFADEAGRSEEAAKASADIADQQAALAAGHAVDAALAAAAAQARVADASAIVAQADPVLRALVIEAQSGVDAVKAEIAASASAAEDRIADCAAGFEADVQTLATATSSQVSAAIAHVARFSVPIEQVARAALDAERRRLVGARDDLLRFTTIIEG